ncbi:MAG: hypothetical protein NTX33_09680 [Propionibacteriales bacterium]|nr:hypothetical protein [Propionibacteriales bacterium]
MNGPARRLQFRPLRLAVLAIGFLVLVLAAVGGPSGERVRVERVGEPVPVEASDIDVVAEGVATPAGVAPSSPVAQRWRTERLLPRGGMLIAYYGTAGSGALGVLGETSPDRAHRRLERAAKPFERTNRPVRLVYELIVTVADAYPGKDGDYSHDIGRAAVQTYVDAARANDALLVLDIQTGRSNFLDVAKRWAWALAEPHVGLALDPEWRMRRHEVPGQVIGSVRAREVNRVSAWLSDLVVSRNLPEKAFVLHQFRTSMLPDVRKIVGRDGLQMIQHVDGFGTPGQKRTTFEVVARPTQFAMGLKLFYDEDVHLMNAKAVHRIRPHVRFVSYQ